MDESTLTGESVQVSKEVGAVGKAITEVYKASNILFTGTTVAEGSARGLVVASGNSTEFGKISKLTVETEDESGFE